MALDDNLTPVNRFETFLALDAGMDVKMPDGPYNRLEQWLILIAQNGGGGGEGGTTNYALLSNKPQINGVTLNGDKSTEELGIVIPAKTSDLTNDSGFQTAEQVSGSVSAALTAYSTTAQMNAALAEKADKSDIPTDFYTKSEVDTKLSGKANTADIPTDFYSKSEVDTKLSGKVSAESGKGLSTNDYTTEEKTKLAGIEAGAEANPDVATEDADGLMAAADKRKIAALEQQNALLQELIAGVDAPIHRTASGNPAAVSDGYADAAVKALSVEIQPVQSGSGDPSPDNVRPITGWDSVAVARTGRNLVPYPYDGTISGTGTDTTSWTVDSEGKITVKGYTESGEYSRFAVNAFRLPAGTYLLGTDPAADERLSVSLHVHDHDRGDLILYTLRGYSSTPTRFTLSEDTNILVSMQVGYAVTLPESGFTLRPYLNAANAGWSADIWTPYQGAGQALTIPTGGAGTVYGGALDVVSGTLTVTHGYIASYAGETLPGAWISDRDVYAAGTVPSTGAQVVYALASPVTRQLTAQEVTTLAGYNVVSADAGAVSVTYRADPELALRTESMTVQENTNVVKTSAAGNLSKATVQPLTTPEDAEENEGALE